MMLDRTAFLRPIAHRGLHDAARSIVENTAGAFRRAIERGYGIECDLQPAAAGLPVVFHDFTLQRLLDDPREIAGISGAELAGLRYRGTGESIITFADLLEIVDGRVPVLVEIKTSWTPLPETFLAEVARLAGAYRGPLALMSFDPYAMAAMKALAADVPRGLVAGNYRERGWWADRLDAERRYRLSHLLEAGPLAASFHSYFIDDLPTPVTRYLHEVQGLPLFAWTIRSKAQLAAARRWSDAPIFEGIEP